MRAIVHTGAGGVEVLALRDVPAPEPGPHQIRVRVHAAGLNRADLLQRRGGYAAPAGWPPDIPGLEYAGTVETVGTEVTCWKVGDRVMGLVGGGAHAEMVVVHEDETMPIPSTLSFIEAAAIPEAFLTAYDALFARGRLAAQERVLLHAVGSGVGTAAVQLAKRHGATVIGTSRTSAKLAEALALGVDQGVDTSAAAFRSLIAPVDVIIDVLGGPAFLDNLALLKPKGRLVLLGFLQGPKVAEMTLEPILRQRLEVVGTVMRTRPLEERIPLVHQFAQRILPQFNPGFRDGVGVHGDTPLRPIVAVSYPMSEIAEAHRAMEHNTVFGKIVLTWP